jgi:hypothetical protein
VRQGLKPAYFGGLIGTTEVVPFQNDGRKSKQRIETSKQKAGS